MSWKNKISTCFGDVDKKFAGHPSDEKAARELLDSAFKENIGWQEFLDGIESWLKDQGLSKEKIKQEMDKVKNLPNYFSAD